MKAAMLIVLLLCAERVEFLLLTVLAMACCFNLVVVSFQWLVSLVCNECLMRNIHTSQPKQKGRHETNSETFGPRYVIAKKLAV